VSSRIKNILLYLVLSLGVLSNCFASTTVYSLSRLSGNASKINVEKSAEGQYIIKAWEALSELPQSFRTIDNIKAIDAFETLKNGSLSSIKSKLSTLSSDAHQAFLNGIKHVGDNGILSSSLTLNRIPSVQEIADATLRIKQYRIANGIPTDKNFGHLGGNLSGGSVTNVSDEIISSGPAVPVGQRVFDAIEVGGWERYTDSEYKMLNKLALDLGAPPGVQGYKNLDVTGSLKVVSERPYCSSCQGVIQQFNDMFPNVEITLIDGVR
jgi:hypothetical protein